MKTLSSDDVKLLQDALRNGLKDAAPGIGDRCETLIKQLEGATVVVDSQSPLLTIAESLELMEVGRKAIEDELIHWRDERLSSVNRRNGFCIRERDGTPSSIIRFGPEYGVGLALEKIAKHLEAKTTEVQA